MAYVIAVLFAGCAGVSTYWFAKLHDPTGAGLAVTSGLIAIIVTIIESRRP